MVLSKIKADHTSLSGGKIAMQGESEMINEKERLACRQSNSDLDCNLQTPSILF